MLLQFKNSNKDKKSLPPDSGLSIEPNSNFKVMVIENEKIIVPTEEYIREKMEVFYEYFEKNNLVLMPYTGSSSFEEMDREDSDQSTDSENSSDKENTLLPNKMSKLQDITEEDIKKFTEVFQNFPYVTKSMSVQIKNLERKLINDETKEVPLFDANYDFLPSMKNGHISNEEGEGDIKRSFTVEASPYEPIACIYFIIDPKEKDCFISALGVKEAYQRNGIGTALLHLAIQVAALYGCDSINLEYTDDSYKMYLNNGFYKSDAYMTLSLTDPASLKCAQRDIKRKYESIDLKKEVKAHRNIQKQKEVKKVKYYPNI